MKYTKGLSTVVTTLIIVLLVLAAIGIIWNPIRELLTKSGSSIEQTRCLDVDLRAEKVVNTSATDYSVTLRRTATGDGEFGAKLMLFDAAGNAGGIEDSKTLFKPLELKIVNITGPADSVKVEITPYFVDGDTGEKKLCEIMTKFSFTN